MTTTTLDRPGHVRAVRATEIVAAAALQYALARALARMVTVATRTETDELAGHAVR